jgi:hypothetical protein
MKKKILELVVLLASLSILTVVVLWSSAQPVQVYHQGEALAHTTVYFDGFEYRNMPNETPPLGVSSMPTMTNQQVLCAVFKPTSSVGSGSQSTPSANYIQLNLEGNTTTTLGSSVESQYYTIIAYDLEDKSITVVYG